MQGWPKQPPSHLLKQKEKQTMTNIEKVNKALENASEDKIKEVLDFLGYNEKFVPKLDEEYWLITTLGKIDCFQWVNDTYDNYQLSRGNVYRTKEEAVQVLDVQTRKAKLIKEIEDSSDEINWGDGSQCKYSISYNHATGSLGYTSWNMVQYQQMVYTTNSQFLEELLATSYDEVKELLFENE